jgi:hypothetical protein
MQKYRREFLDGVELFHEAFSCVRDHPQLVCDLKLDLPWSHFNISTCEPAKEHSLANNTTCECFDKRVLPVGVRDM